MKPPRLRFRRHLAKRRLAGSALAGILRDAPHSARRRLNLRRRIRQRSPASCQVFWRPRKTRADAGESRLFRTDCSAIAGHLAKALEAARQTPAECGGAGVGAGFVSLPKKPQKNAAKISVEISIGKKFLSGARRRPNTRHICKQPYTASYNTAAYAPARSRGDSPLNRRINYLERRNINTAPITAPFEPRIGVEFSDTRILPPLLQSNSARLPKP